MTRSVVIVGGGPRGTGVLERIVAGAPGHGVDAEHPLDVHVVDPYPAGAGRIWRTKQSELLWMNSMAADVTMWTDDSVVCAGPIIPGPSLIEWAEEVRDAHAEPEGRVGEEVRALRANTFSTRQLQSHYLADVFHRVLDLAPPGVRIHLHEERAAGIEDGDVRRVRLESGEVLDADALILASGHLDAAPTDDETALVRCAERLGLRYFPPEQTTDSDLDAIPPGETVIARGMGLAFIDLMVLLYEGRGGRFEEEPDGDDDGSGRGRLRYVPSGREVYLHVGSGRGVPYHAKTEYTLIGPRPPLPTFFGPEQVAELASRQGGASLRDDAWPLIAKEAGWGWYHELFHGHPDRVHGDWDTFAVAYADLDWYSVERERLVERHVPDEADRLDFEQLDRPLDGVRTDSETLQKFLRNYIADDLARHVDPAHTEELGAFTALLSAFMMSVELAGRDGLTAKSRARDLTWWQNLFSSMASGPPGPRLRQLLALNRDGFVTFLGSGVSVEIEESTPAFVATSAALDEPPTTAGTFVDARLASPSVRRSSDPMLRSLMRAGLLDEETLSWNACSRGDDYSGVVEHSTGLIPVRTADHRVLTGSGYDEPADRLFAIGPHTTVRLPGAFSRPNTNNLSFRANDALAQAVLATVAAG
ncbi:FAD/NAD(P)-binding protein [Actinomycetospora termitidis]|uniref:FAD/NAD(P)-binding protein n=1 Tax=Actinomycetospora termitidis TaxID=3053470 RepID=A0ABT7MH84_9PSEU|nr:FAD/NAD(P)-binding protein [Actinomycetospora sp. Odt1-22]MDL5160038.1 FAD/NAD(P)-binding protein [Actinomycetospora sp. Odt1-22]